MPDSQSLLFVRRFLANPLKVGAVLPSSPTLSRLIARHALGHEGAPAGADYILELGAGTGTVSQALLDAGLPEERLVMIELDADMHEVLVKRFPRATVLLGDATQPSKIVPEELHGRFTTVISGIPALQFPLSLQKSFVADCFGLMVPDGRLVQFTYSLASPLPRKDLQLTGKRMAMTFANVPPAHVWAYTWDAAEPAEALRGAA